MRDRSLRKHVANLLSGRGAHLDVKSVFAGMPASESVAKPAGAPHTPWQLLEHIRIAQWDILEFSRDAKHVSPGFPDGYWPKTEAPPSDEAWEKSLRSVAAELEEMRKLVLDPRTDLFARIPHGTGQTILREALLIADHNAYHAGQVVLLRRLLGAWNEK
ncbi:MAG: DinB family protein [Candidatus Acidiferrales bacterium]